MKILITGSNGFIGKNLIATLQTMQRGNIPTPVVFDPIEIFPFDVNTPKEVLNKYCREADFVIHLAGINRPKTESEFMKGNFGFTSELLELLRMHKNKAPILVTSSIQSALDNPYGRSKKAGEDLVQTYGEEEGVNTYIYRLPNVFGKWSRPNYNSAVATFCHNIARDLPIIISDESIELSLVYIDNVIQEIINAMRGTPTLLDNQLQVIPVHKTTLGHIVSLLRSFKRSDKTLELPNTADEFTKKLHATYISFLPEDQFSHDLVSHIDHRGSFTEVFRTPERGQFSINIQHPGITKGEHWHHTKNEKFIVVTGRGVIRFRHVLRGDIISYDVSGDKLQVIDIPPGYTHSIENTGESDMLTLMWANECFDLEKPDTYFLKVAENDQ